MQEGGQEEFQYSGKSQYVEMRPETPLQPQATNQNEVLWQASEFIEHEKNSSWFAIFVGGTLVLGILMYAITRDILSTIAVLVAAIAFGVFAKQKPRTLTYCLTSNSIKVGQKAYNYDDFKSFSIVQDGGIYGIMLEPVQRFMPPITIYFDQNDGERIFDALAQHLPHEERQLDFVDKFMRKIRF